MLRKSIFIFIAAVFLLSGVAALAATKLPDVVATVNGEKISKEELTNSLIDWNAPMALDQLIMYRLVGQEAKKAGVVVTAAAISARFDELKKNLPPGQTFEDMLKRNGMTPGAAFSLMKMQLQSEGVLKKQVKVTAEDLANYRRARHILIRIPSTADAKEKEASEATAKTKIEEIEKEIKDNKISFEDAAKKYSEDPGSKDKGGDLDYFAKDQMSPEFDKAVFEMKPGEISAPIKTSYGYHLIQLIGLGADAKGADRKKLEDMLIPSKMGEMYRDWMLTIRNKANIVSVFEPAPPPAPKPAAVRPTTKQPGMAPPPPPSEAPPPPPSEIPNPPSDAEGAAGVGTPPPPDAETAPPPMPPDAGTAPAPPPAPAQ